MTRGFALVIKGGGFFRLFGAYLCTAKINEKRMRRMSESERQETKKEKDISKALTQKHFMILIVVIALTTGFLMNTEHNATAVAQAHRIAADMSNVRACTYAYFADTASWPRSLEDIQRQTASKINIDVTGLSVVDDGGALFVKYDGAATEIIPKADNKVAAALKALAEKDNLYAAPTADPNKKPDYAGGKDVYMLIKTANYNPNAQF